MKAIAACLAAVLCAAPQATFASGHGPVFGATTPTLGKGGWSFDTAWTLRASEADAKEQMLKGMIVLASRRTCSFPPRCPSLRRAARCPAHG